MLLVFASSVAKSYERQNKRLSAFFCNSIPVFARPTPKKQFTSTSCLGGNSIYLCAQAIHVDSATTPFNHETGVRPSVRFIPKYHRKLPYFVKVQCLAGLHIYRVGVHPVRIHVRTISTQRGYMDFPPTQRGFL